MSIQPQVQFAAEPTQHGSHFSQSQAPDSQQQETQDPPSWSIASEESESRPEADERGQEVHRMAQQLYEQSPDWVTYFREVLGLGGYVRQTYSTRDELDQFEQSKQYEEIQQMVAKLRERSTSKQPTGSFEPTRVITVRLPKSLHESLRAEAHEKRTSMNKLCISKLLQFIDNNLVPAEA